MPAVEYEVPPGGLWSHFKVMKLDADQTIYLDDQVSSDYLKNLEVLRSDSNKI